MDTVYTWQLDGRHFTLMASWQVQLQSRGARWHWGDEELRFPTAVCFHPRLCRNAATTTISAVRAFSSISFILALGASLIVACALPEATPTPMPSPTPTELVAATPTLTAIPELTATPIPGPMPGNHRGNALAIELGEAASVLHNKPGFTLFRSTVRRGNHLFCRR